mgnify:CR=1 FL=1
MGAVVGSAAIAALMTARMGAHFSSTRGPDAVVYGQTMITFTTTFALAGFLSDPDLPPTLLS